MKCFRQIQKNVALAPNIRNKSPNSGEEAQRRGYRAPSHVQSRRRAHVAREHVRRSNNYSRKCARLATHGRIVARNDINISLPAIVVPPSRINEAGQTREPSAADIPNIPQLPNERGIRARFDVWKTRFDRRLLISVSSSPPRPCQPASQPAADFHISGQTSERSLTGRGRRRRKRGGGLMQPKEEDTPVERLHGDRVNACTLLGLKMSEPYERTRISLSSFLCPLG